MENILTQHIQRSADVFAGKPRIAGHRIRVIDIVLWHEKLGLSPDEILGLYPGISLSDVHAALAYYFDHRREMEDELDREAAVNAETKAGFSSKLREKLGG